MANKKITDFAILSSANDEDVLLVSSDNETYCITVGTLKNNIKAYANTILSSISNGLTYKGFVNYFSNLPTSGNTLGDVYTVRYQGNAESGKPVVDGTEYVWSATDNAKAEWIALGPNAAQKMDKLESGTVGNVMSVGSDGNAQDSGTALSMLLTRGMLDVPGGIPSLDRSGKISISQLPAAGLLPQVIVSSNIGAAITCTCGSKSISVQNPTGTISVNLPDYGDWVVVGTSAGKQTTPVTVSVDTVKQYRVQLSYFAAILTVVGVTQGAKIYVSNADNSYSAVVGESSTSVTLTVSAAGTYNIWETVGNKSRVLGSISITADGQKYTFQASASTGDKE